MMSMHIFLNLIMAMALLPAAWGQNEANAKPAETLTPALKSFCDKLQGKFNDYHWGNHECDKYKWNHVRNSNLGTPLVWITFGEEKTPAAENTTLILCGVHGDEITPVKFCWDLMKELQEHHTFKDKLVIVAPLVAPDSFFVSRPTRTNGRGVDVNRNFPTADWHAQAHKRWKQIKDKRKFPGHRPASEQETVFQMNLIKRYKPNKVISVHAPLTLLDYDGPLLTSEDGKPAKALLEQMSEKSAGYKISNYPIFPGSLGNWAGKDHHIATYTLELPNTNAQETDKFWNLFKEAIKIAIEHQMKPVKVEAIPAAATAPAVATEKKD
jgi:protein MpaA